MGSCWLAQFLLHSWIESCLDFLDYRCSLNLVITWSLFSLLHEVCKEKKENEKSLWYYVFFKMKSVLNNSKESKVQYWKHAGGLCIKSPTWDNLGSLVSCLPYNLFLGSLFCFLDFCLPDFYLWQPSLLSTKSYSKIDW